MIYDYYCTDCGNRIKGEEIVFDLAQILGLRSGEDDSDMDQIIRITPEDLKELAKNNGTELEDGEREVLEVTLFDVMNYLAQEIESFRDRERFVTMTYDQFVEGSLMTDLRSANSMQTKDVIEETVRKTVDAICAKMKLREAADFGQMSESERQKYRQNTNNWYMRILLEPEFFEGTDKLYSVRFSTNLNIATPDSFLHFTEIRGYCPKCGQPVLKGAGKYKHYLVGFLGAQSAGKTTLFVSMLNDLLGNPERMEELGVQFPELLSDCKFEKISNAMEDNKYGWAVRKTDAEAVVEAFNASFLVQRNHNNAVPVIITFVDIAGELCYDSKKKAVVRAAFVKFPLITSCDLYMLCTCVSQTGYGDNGDQGAAVDSQAILQIANGIYHSHQHRKHTPPLCMVITKIDMARNACEIGRNNPGNPYEAILNNIQNATNGTGIYRLKDQVETLLELYRECDDREIMEAMKWCAFASSHSTVKTYMSMISCSALGMPGRRFEAGSKVKYDPDDPGKRALTVKQLSDQRFQNAPEREVNYRTDGDPFEHSSLDVVWDYILRTLGVTATDLGPRAGREDYVFPYIPSYGEAYNIPEFMYTDYDVRTVYEGNFRGERNRTYGVYQMYLNPSELDVKIREELDKSNEEPQSGGFASFFSIFGAHSQQPSKEERVKNVIGTYLQEHKRN